MRETQPSSCLRGKCRPMRSRCKGAFRLAFQIQLKYPSLRWVNATRSEWRCWQSRSGVTQSVFKLGLGVRSASRRGVRESAPRSAAGEPLPLVSYCVSRESLRGV